MLTLRRMITATAFAVLSASTMMAATISYSNVTASASAPFINTFTLSNFNTALGTLTGVSISLAYTTTGEVDVFNTLSTSQAFTNATSTVPLTLGGPAGLTTSTNAVAGPISGTALPSPPQNAFPGLSASGTLTLSVLPAQFSTFEIPPSGTSDTYSVVAGSGSYTGSAAPGVFFSGSATAGGTTTITYTYTSATVTPEPTSLALIGGGFLVLGLFGKRFRKS